MSLQHRQAWRALIEQVWALRRPENPFDSRLFMAAARDAMLAPPPVDGVTAQAFAEALVRCCRVWPSASDERRAATLDALAGLADCVWRLMEEAREAGLTNRVGLD